jgi:hypothetical protein
VYKAAKGWGQTIIFTTSATRNIITGQKDIPSDTLYCWLSHAEPSLPDTTAQWASRSNVGLMLNQAKDSRLLYAISHMMSLEGRVLPTNRIINDNFAGVLNIAEADLLTEKGVSFWFKTVQKTYPFSLFLGKVQAYIKYWQAIIDHNLIETISNFVHEGHTFLHLPTLENRIMATLALFGEQLGDSMEVRIPSFGELTDADRKMGRLNTVSIWYSVMGEIRVIQIEI